MTDLDDTLNPNELPPLHNGEDERYHLFRLCECTTCEGTGKVVSSDVVYNGRGGIEASATLQRCFACRGEGRTHELIATATDPQSVGVALVTLGREGEWDECPIGVLDTMGEKGQKWIVRPWLPSPRNISDAGRVLRRSQDTSERVAMDAWRKTLTDLEGKGK